MIDLDDISNCPVGPACLGCGNSRQLEVRTVSTMVGVLCVTACEPCFDEGEGLAGFNLPRAVRATLEHCGHLGITADQMAEQMRREEALDG